MDREMKIPSVLFDLLAATGFALMLTGLWWIYPPAALIVGGGGSLTLACWGARRWGS